MASLLQGRNGLFKLGGCLAALALLYSPVFLSLYQDWLTLPDYSHGFLVPAICLFFVWRMWDDLTSLAPQPHLAGLLVLMTGMLLLLLGVLASESFTMRFSLLVVLAGMVIYFLGLSHFSKLAFPISFLIFMIPIPSVLLTSVTFPLQLFVSTVASSGLRFLGLNVSREGNIIHLDTVSLQVVEACSGMRSLIALLALGTTFAFLMSRSPWKRVLLIFICLPISVVFNVLRIMITGLLSNRAGAATVEGFSHGISGILFFLLAFLLLAAVWWLLERVKPEPDSVRRPAPLAERRTNRFGSPLPNRRIVIFLAIVVLAGLARGWLSRSETVLNREPLGSLPGVIGQWTLVDESRIGDGAMAVLLVDDYIMRRYQSEEGRSIWLYIGYYTSQREGKQIHSPRQCLPGNGWNWIEEETSSLPGQEGRADEPVLINFALMNNNSEQHIFCWWYQGRGRVYAGEYLNKFYLLLDAITRGRTDGALIRVNLVVEGSLAETKAALLDFTNSLVTLLDHHIPG